MKRLVDIVAAAGALLVTAPLWALIAAGIRLDSPGPVFFRQRRIGHASRPFVIWKFRTMRAGTPDLAKSLLAPDDPRITRVGRVLRRLSLDEVPQLLNILRGDMSLVGPRPALHNQDDLIALRHRAGVDRVRPGVTGYAQVNGREAMSIEEKVAYDAYYVAHRSFALDARILGRTLLILFSSRGTY